MSPLVTLVCLLATLVASLPAAAGERLALVIGNAAYRNVPALANPANDARLMARTLRAAGFRVSVVLDADRPALRGAVERFGRDLAATRPGALALVYFAGHGVRSDGFNYLLPVDVDIRSEADIAREAVAAEWVLQRIEAPGVTHLLVLDACRNNPFDGRGSGSIPELGDGLARMTPRRGSLIAYATGPGEVALDGAGDHSPYAAALARAIGTPGLTVEEIFAQVRRRVETATGGGQVPWERSSLDAAVSLRPGASAAAIAPSEDDRSEGWRLGLSVTFRPGRWGGGARGGCGTVYRYDPVRVPPAGGPTRHVRSVSGGAPVGLALSARLVERGTELSIVPVSAASSGREVTVRLADLAPGRDHAVHTDARHPDLFGCGAMTIYLSRED